MAAPAMLTISLFAPVGLALKVADKDDCEGRKGRVEI